MTDCRSEQTDNPLSDRSGSENRRHLPDRRCGRDRRGELRFEYDRRNNHGRRRGDKDLWKASFNH